MAKSSYLFKLLSVAAICFCSNAGGTDVGTKQQGQIVPVALNRFPTVKYVYDHEVGVREVGKNGGKRVEEYLKYAGLKKGQPWCAAFVCWAYGQVGINNPKTGSTVALMAEEKIIWRYNLLNQSTARLPQTGDVFGVWFQTLKRIAHVGFVDQWNGSWLITVEGNTNKLGSREGDGVYRKRRLVKGVYAVASYR